MLLALETWLPIAGVTALVVAILVWLLQRKRSADYKLDRHEHPSGFDFTQQQSELKREHARIEHERRRAEFESHRLAAQANAQFEIAAEQESRELQEMAQATASDLDALRTSRAAEFEAAAQDAIRRQREEVAALLRNQESEIERIRREQELEVEARRAEYERAKEAHFNVLRRFEPRPPAVSYAMPNPAQDMANVMQAGYARIAWAFAALARKRQPPEL